MPRKTALITGASAGIGCEFAWIFAKTGHDLVLVARNESRLNQLAKELREKYEIAVKVIAADLSLPRAPDQIFLELQNSAIAVDILVNNAGFGTHGFFSETGLNDELEMIQVNMTALTHLTKLFLREMLKRRGGKILNVASTAAFQPGPLMAVYYATKAYVLSFSEALSEELRGTGIVVSCLCPGPTTSEFQARANLKDMLLLKGRLMSAKAVAQIGYDGLMKGKRVVIAGVMNKIFAVLSREAPRGLVLRMIKILQKQKETLKTLKI